VERVFGRGGRLKKMAKKMPKKKRSKGEFYFLEKKMKSRYAKRNKNTKRLGIQANEKLVFSHRICPILLEN